MSGTTGHLLCAPQPHEHRACGSQVTLMTMEWPQGAGKGALSDHGWPLNHFTDAGLAQHHLTAAAFCSPHLSCGPASFPSLPDTGQL